MDYEKITIFLDLIYLSILIKDNKILKSEIVFEEFENFDKKHQDIVDEVKNYFYGKILNFNMNFLYLDSLSSFQKEVLLKLLSIQRGKVTTYKSLSLMINRGKSFRRVGSCLSKNPFPIIIPCHRVIKSNFSIGEYSYGKELKKKLLIFEGVKFDSENRVSKEFIL